MSRFGPVPLTPTAFLDRARAVHRDQVALVDGDVRRTYAELADRCERLAGRAGRARRRARRPRLGAGAEHRRGARGALRGAVGRRGAQRAQHPAAAPPSWRTIVGHAGARVLLVDTDLADLGRAVAEQARRRRAARGRRRPRRRARGPARAGADPLHVDVEDELSLLSLNYTSGTTGRPKGVMYSHRGAYLQALAMAAQTALDASSSYLWTLPMFHCNGWCFPWAVTAAGATHVALRKVEPGAHLAGAARARASPTCARHRRCSPASAGAPEAADGPVGRTRCACRPAAPRPPRRCSRGWPSSASTVTHLYGLTETYGPAAICDWKPEWDDARRRRSRRGCKPRQGVANLVSLPLRVLDEDGQRRPGRRRAASARSCCAATTSCSATTATSEATAAADAGRLVPHRRHGGRCTPTATSSSRTAPRTSSSPAARTSPRSRSSRRSTPTPPSWRAPSSRRPTRSGARRSRRSSCCARARTATEQELIEHVQGRIARFKAPRQVALRRAAEDRHRQDPEVRAARPAAVGASRRRAAAACRRRRRR